MDVPDQPSPTRSILFATGCFGLGCVGLIFRDFALQWEPVPTDLSYYHPLALISALVLVCAAGALWFTRTRAVASFALAIFFALWTLTLHFPRVATAPGNVALWLGLCEIAALAAGALAVAGEAWRSRKTLLSARIAMGICALVFGLSHFVYAKFTAAMVPDWMPKPLWWAYATGGGHVIAGLAMLSGIRSRLAALALGAMCGSFVLLVHLPMVIGAPTSHAQWTALFIACSIAGAALATSAAPERSDDAPSRGPVEGDSRLDSAASRGKP